MPPLNAAALAAQTFTEPDYVLEPLIMPGCTLFAGKAKIGKSFLGMQISLVATGHDALPGILVPAEPRLVSYYALEDTPRRLSRRLQTILGALKAIADGACCAIVVIHHLRKLPDTDPLDAVSGTAGLTGAADSVFVLTHRRRSPEDRLYVTGRDIDQQDIELQFIDGRWHAAAAPTTSTTPDSAIAREILDVLATGPHMPVGIATRTGRSAGGIRV